jgi:hypothetical protein
MMKIPTTRNMLTGWAHELCDECLATAEERNLVYTRATSFYYTGSYTANAALYNKIRPFIDRLAGFLMQPTDVRFQIIFDSTEHESVLERAQVMSEKLSADYRQSDSDITFAEAATWALVNGCSLLKHRPFEDGFHISQVHPVHFGVLSESTLDLDEQEAFCHVSFMSKSRLRTMLEESDCPGIDGIMERIDDAKPTSNEEPEMTYFHQMVVGGLNPLGDGTPSPEAAGVVNVFPIPTPWRPNRRMMPTVKLCELWVKDRARGGDYTTIQVVYPDIVIDPDTRRNLSRIPGHHPFIKVQHQPTPGYFWGRSIIADVQMLQDVLSKRLRDIKVMWDRNVNAAQVFSGFTGITEEDYFKIINEGGFLSDPNPNAKATKLIEPPPDKYLEELQFIMQLFDEAAGFSPIMGGQGEPGVRAGVHAQTLVRTSSPRLIDQAARMERQLASSGYLAMRLMQAQDSSTYVTDKGIEFQLTQLPDNYQVQVDSHSASPAFAEDNRQVAIALARAGAIDAEDLIHMLHPPGAELLLARLRQRQKAQAQAKQQEEQKELLRDVLHLPSHKTGQGGRKPK